MVITNNDIVKYRELSNDYQQGIPYRKLQKIHLNSIFLHVLGYATINPNFIKIMKNLIKNKKVVDELKKNNEFDVCIISNDVIDTIIKHNKIDISNKELVYLHKEDEINEDSSDENTSQRYGVVIERYKKAMKMYKDYCINVLMNIDPKMLHSSIISYYRLHHTDYIEDLYFYEYEDAFSSIKNTLNTIAKISLKNFRKVDDLDDLDINRYFIWDTKVIDVLYDLLKKGLTIKKIDVKYLIHIIRWYSTLDSKNIPEKFPKKFCKDFKNLYSLVIDDNKFNIIELLVYNNNKSLWRAFIKILLSCKCITMIKNYINIDYEEEEKTFSKYDYRYDSKETYNYNKKKFISYLKKGIKDLKDSEDDTYVNIRNILRNKNIHEPGISKKTMKYTSDISKSNILYKLDAVLKKQTYKGRTPKSSSS